jgi:hypothetical protein
VSTVSTPVFKTGSSGSNPDTPARFYAGFSRLTRASLKSKSVEV